MSTERQKSFAEAAEPLIKWMNENSTPHAIALVQTDSAELFDGTMRIVNTDHIKG